MTFQKAKVVMLPTKKAEIGSLMKCIKEMPNDNATKLNKLTLNKNWKVAETNGNEFWEPQHLYFTIDERPENGDWFIELNLKGTRSSYCNKPFLCDIGNTGSFVLTKNSGNFPFPENCYKIIATTDLNITIEKGEYNIGELSRKIMIPTEKTILPQPSKQFIDKYRDMYNKNTPITDVLIEYTKERRTLSIEDKKTPNGTDYKEVEYEWIEELKVNSNNEITIKKIKDTFTKEEVDDLLDRNTAEITNQLLQKYKNSYTREEVIGLMKLSWDKSLDVHKNWSKYYYSDNKPVDNWNLNDWIKQNM